MSLLSLFQEFIRKENLFSPKDRLLLAVSGGVDSVVLCELCHQAGHHFIIAHCNFQLRGQESERDEQLVRSLGARYQVTVLVNRFETQQYAGAKKISIQVAARELRYAWFNEIISGQQSIDVNDESSTMNDTSSPGGHETLASGTAVPGSRFHVLTAHHLDDNIETILMNFCKGTGIAGLRGMLPKHSNIVRPLLFAKKEALKQFAETQHLPWAEDSSNESDKYARNYFRNQLIPLINNIYPEAEHNLAGNLQRFKDIEILYHQSIDLHKKKLLEYKGNEIHIPVMKLQKAVPLLSVLYEIIKPYHFSAGQATEALALLHSETGRYIQSDTHRLIRNRNWLIIAPVSAAQADHILIEGTGSLETKTFKLKLTIHPNFQSPIPSSETVAYVDAAGIQFPLLLRKWKTGDYFYPLGMQKKKKLSRFFIDQKLSKTSKEAIWVLEAGKRIVWVIGQRIDDRCKVTAATSQVLRIELK